MESIEQFVKNYLERYVTATDEDILEAYSRKMIFWGTIRKFKKQQSVWRHIKDMRQRGIIKQIEVVDHEPTFRNVGVSKTITYQLW